MRRSRDMVSVIKKQIDKIKKIQKKEDSFTEEEVFNFLVCTLFIVIKLQIMKQRIFFRNKNVYSKYFRKIYFRVKKT